MLYYTVTMIQVLDIDKSFAAVPLFRQARFSINRGEKIGLVGRNGQGKSTLLNIVAGVIAPDSGTVVFPRDYRVARLEQLPRFTAPTIREHVSAGLPPADAESHWLAEKVLAGLGFDTADMTRPPAEFSGGYQIRLNLARMLVSGAQLLLLDEPNNYLDVVAIRWLTKFLQNWTGEFMLVTHDRYFMDSVVTHILGISQHGVRKITGKTAAYYEQRAAEDDIQEKARCRDERRRQRTEAFVNRFRAKARQAGLAQSRLKMLAKLTSVPALPPAARLSFAFQALEFNAPAMLTAAAIGFGYEPTQLLFSDINLSIGRRDRIAVMGKNGKGKSTLLRLLVGELAPQSGGVKKHPDLRVAYFGQTNIDRLQADKTVFEEVQSADPDAPPQRARDCCGVMMFSQDAALKKIAVLSGGERSRVLLAKILMQPCHLLILDEPTNHLDMESTEALLTAIETFTGSVVIVTHNELFLQRLAEHLIVFDGGTARSFTGSYHDFLERVGWRSETAPAAVPTEQRRAEQKRLQARLRQERSRVLQPLQQAVQEQEGIISDAEEELRRVTAELVEASQQGDAPRIAVLARRSKELPPLIDAAYTALDQCLQEFERRRDEFSRRLAAAGDA